MHNRTYRIGAANFGSPFYLALGGDERVMSWIKRALLNRKEFKSFTWWESFMSGHISAGPITIYGENAMHWAVNIRTKRWGYICFRLPLRCFGQWWPMYFYISPNGTPWASTFSIPKRRD